MAFSKITVTPNQQVLRRVCRKQNPFFFFFFNTLAWHQTTQVTKAHCFFSCLQHFVEAVCAKIQVVTASRCRCSSPETGCFVFVFFPSTWRAKCMLIYVVYLHLHIHFFFFFVPVCQIHQASPQNSGLKERNMDYITYEPRIEETPSFVLFDGNALTC